MPRAARASAGNGGVSSGRRSANPATGHRACSAGMSSSGGWTFFVASTSPSLDASAARITLPARPTDSTSAASLSAPVQAVPPMSDVPLALSLKSTS